MLRTISTTISVLALALGLSLPSTAFAADKTGTTGTVESVEINSPSADGFQTYHGRVYIGVSSKNIEYRWGGTACGTKTITDQQIDLLYRAMRANKVQITPSYKDGQGGKRCLVGFKLEEKAKKKGKKPAPT